MSAAMNASGRHMHFNLCHGDCFGPNHTKCPWQYGPAIAMLPTSPTELRLAAQAVVLADQQREHQGHRAERVLALPAEGEGQTGRVLLR